MIINETIEEGEEGEIIFVARIRGIFFLPKLCDWTFAIARTVTNLFVKIAILEKKKKKKIIVQNAIKTTI